MRDPRLRDELSTVTNAVFEQTAFVFPEPADLLDGIALDEFDLIIVDVVFSGDEEGCVSLVVPVAFCRELSENMLGEDVTETGLEEASFDAAKEIANIITGQLLTQLFGSTAVFDLAPPKVHEISREQLFKAVEQREHVCAQADDYPIISLFSLGKVAHEYQSIDCR